MEIKDVFRLVSHHSCVSDDWCLNLSWFSTNRPPAPAQALIISGWHHKHWQPFLSANRCRRLITPAAGVVKSSSCRTTQAQRQWLSSQSEDFNPTLTSKTERSHDLAKAKTDKAWFLLRAVHWGFRLRRDAQMYQKYFKKYTEKLQKKITIKRLQK